MKWWMWTLLGLVVFAIIGFIGYSLFKREAKTDQLAKAREAKAEKSKASENGVVHETAT